MIPKSALEALNKLVEKWRGQAECISYPDALSRAANELSSILQSIEPTEARAVATIVVGDVGQVDITWHKLPSEIGSCDLYPHPAASPLTNAEPDEFEQRISAADKFMQELAEDQKAETQPVAWMIRGPEQGNYTTHFATVLKLEAEQWQAKSDCTVTPLYTHPSPQPEAATIDAEAIAKELLGNFTMLHGKDGSQVMRHEIEAILNRHASEHAGKQGWVKCSERMPAYGTWCLCWTIIHDAKSTGCLEKLYWGGLGELHWEQTHDEGPIHAACTVTHWQPLPAAPDSAGDHTEEKHT